MQKAIFATEIGKPVSLGERPIPTPKEGQVLIKVTSTLLLPHDTYGRDYGLFIGKKLPFGLGSNIVGQVVKLGSASKYAVGDLIFGAGLPDYENSNMCGLQEHAILESDYSAKVPDGFTDDQLATLPINVTTSFMAMFHPQVGFGLEPPYEPLPKPITLVVNGPGSNVGRYGLQFAKMARIETVIAIASIGNEALLKELGATHVIDRNLPPAEIAKAIHAINPVIEYMYDCESWEWSLAAEILSNDSQLPTLHPVEGLDGKTGPALREKLPSIREDVEFYKHLTGWVQAKQVLTTDFKVVDGLDVEKVNEALDSYRDGSAVVQTIVHP